MFNLYLLNILKYEMQFRAGFVFIGVLAGSEHRTAHRIRRLISTFGSVRLILAADLKSIDKIINRFNE